MLKALYRQAGQRRSLSALRHKRTLIKAFAMSQKFGHPPLHQAADLWLGAIRNHIAAAIAEGLKDGSILVRKVSALDTSALDVEDSDILLAPMDQEPRTPSLLLPIGRPRSSFPTAVAF